jgi:hypothetical protein
VILFILTDSASLLQVTAAVLSLQRSSPLTYMFVQAMAAMLVVRPRSTATERFCVNLGAGQRTLVSRAACGEHWFVAALESRRR